MRIIAIANQKGGVGKTTTAAALAHALARRGYTVCAADLDAQGNLSVSFGLKPEPGLFQLLTGGIPLSDVLTEARPNLWLLPSDTTTAKLKTILAGEAYREGILARALGSLDVDYVILDTGPSRDLIHDMAHQAAGEVVIPAALDHLALVGVAQQVDTLGIVREHGHPIEVMAILPTFYDRVTIESSTNLQKLAKTFGGLVLPAVPRTVKLREAPAYGYTVWEHLPANHPACQAYERLTERVIHG